jgi:hypothetical protein
MPKRRKCTWLVSMMIACLAAPPALAQAPPSADTAQGASTNPWNFIVAPYGWATFISGTQTVKGQTATVNSDPVQMFADSQSLISFMMYGEARYQDRVGLFIDVIYANLTAGQSETRNFSLQGIVSGSAVLSASARYQTLTTMFGAAYQVTKVGPDRSTEGANMAGVGQTAFDVLAGGRWWHQAVDLTLNFSGNVSVTAPGLSLSASRTQVQASSGSIDWVDPLVGFRVRHRFTPGQQFWLEADIGGFGIGSRISAQAQAIYGFDLGRFIGADWSGVIGYRALYVDYSQGSGSSLYEMNEVQHGPLLGVSGRF